LIIEKLRFRQTNIAGLEDRILRKEQRLKALWNGRLAHQIEAFPEFDAVFRAVHRELRQAGFEDRITSQFADDPGLVQRTRLKWSPIHPWQHHALAPILSISVELGA